MADIQQDYGAAAFALDMSGAATIGNGVSGLSDALDNRTRKFLDYHIMVGVTTGGSATATGLIEIYVKGSVDGVVYEDDGNDRWIGTITLAAAGAQTRNRLVSIAAAFNGGVPPFTRLRLRNATGAALADATATVIGISGETV